MSPAFTSPPDNRFTLFIILPWEEVCSVRNLPSGVTFKGLRCRLELLAGCPAHTYRIVSSNGRELQDDQPLVVSRNVWDGFMVRIQPLDEWRHVYDGVIKGRLDGILRSTPKGEDSTDMDNDDVDKMGVALFLSCWMGHSNLCKNLLKSEIDPNTQTPFGRTAMFACVTKDNDTILDVLMVHGGDSTIRDALGESALGVGKRCMARQCVNRIHSFHISRLQSFDNSYDDITDGNVTTNVHYALEVSPSSVASCKGKNINRPMKDTHELLPENPGIRYKRRTKSAKMLSFESNTPLLCKTNSESNIAATNKNSGREADFHNQVLVRRHTFGDAFSSSTNSLLHNTTRQAIGYKCVKPSTPKKTVTATTITLTPRDHQHFSAVESKPRSRSTTPRSPGITSMLRVAIPNQTPTRLNNSSKSKMTSSNYYHHQQQQHNHHQRHHHHHSVTWEEPISDLELTSSLGFSQSGERYKPKDASGSVGTSNTKAIRVPRQTIASSNGCRCLEENNQSLHLSTSSQQMQMKKKHLHHHQQHLQQYHQHQHALDNCSKTHTDVATMTNTMLSDQDNEKVAINKNNSNNNNNNNDGDDDVGGKASGDADNGDISYEKDAKDVDEKGETTESESVASKQQSSWRSRGHFAARRRKTESLKTTKRRIELLESQKRNTKKRETFDQWLKKKERQIFREQPTDDSDDSSDEDEDRKKENAEAFNNWLKGLDERSIKQNNPNSAVSLHKRKSRAIQGLIGIDGTSGLNENRKIGDDPSKYMHSYKMWQKKKADGKENNKSEISDFNEKKAKRALEEMRNAILAEAVTYDEWLEYEEERKKMAKVISLSKRVYSAGKGNNNKRKESAKTDLSFEKWKQELEVKEAKVKNAQLRMRRQQEHEHKLRDNNRSSSAVSHELWVQRKHESEMEERRRKQEQKEKQQERMKSQNDQKKCKKHYDYENKSDEDVDEKKHSGFEAWVSKKHEEEIRQVERNINREHQLLEELRRQKQSLSVT